MGSDESDTSSSRPYEPHVPLVPPLNFAMVEPGVYRSGHPNKRNFPFLRKLQLKTIIYFAKEDYPLDIQTFIESEGIQLFHYRTEGNREPFLEMNCGEIRDALLRVLDKRYHPVLIHCLKGKHRIGCLIGCLRKLQNWSMTSIFEEYRRFAGTKVLADQEFIEIFNEPVKFDPKFRPLWFRQEDNGGTEEF